jgi:hypothetical protein
MTSHPTLLANRFAGLRAAFETRTGELRPASAAALDAMLLTLLASLLGRLERLARIWHPTAPQENSAEDEHTPLFPHNLLYLFGPRRNRGMRANARTTPLAHPRTARAPPMDTSCAYAIRSESPRMGHPMKLQARPLLLAALILLSGCATRTESQGFRLACPRGSDGFATSQANSGNQNSASALGSFAGYAALSVMCMATR